MHQSNLAVLFNMALRCQIAPYEQEFSTKVISVTKNEASNEFSVVLEDTILFPEGLRPLTLSIA